LFLNYIQKSQEPTPAQRNAKLVKNIIKKNKSLAILRRQKNKGEKKPSLLPYQSV
jgi:hypothetical protein